MWHLCCIERMHVCTDVTAVFKAGFGGVNIWGAEISELAGAKVSKGTGTLWQLQTRAHIASVWWKQGKGCTLLPRHSLTLHAGVYEMAPASKERPHHMFTS